MALALLLVFLPVLRFEFLTLDDGIHVYNNRYLQGLTWANLRHFWTGSHENLYLPLTYTVWALLAGISGFFQGASGSALNPQLFHAANLLAHLVATLTVFLILREVLDADDRAALTGALFFAVHPLQVETVAWVSAFRDLFSVCWALMALLFYLRYAKKGGGPSGDRRDYWLASVFFVFSLLSKPGAVVLPLLAALLAFLALHRPPRRILSELSPWLALAVPLVLITRLSQPGLAHDFVPGWGERLLVAGDAVAFYLGKLVLPIDLCADYGRSPQFLLGHGWVWITGLLPFGAGLLLLRKAGRPWWLAAGLFVVALLPVLGLIPFDFQRISTVADRYLYLAMLGPALAVGLIAARHRTLASKLSAAGLLLLLGVLSAMQLRHWENSRACYHQILAVNPNSSLANNNLGNLTLQAGDYGQAEILFRKALDLRADFPEAQNNLGLTLAAEGRWREAFAAYKKAIALAPGYPEPYGNLAALYREMGMQNEALDFYQKALRLDPDNAPFHDGLGSVYLETGHGAEARRAFERAIAVDPAYARAYLHLSRFFCAAGEPVQAAHYQDLARHYGLAGPELTDALRRLP